MKKTLSTLMASAAGLGVLFSSISVTEAHAKPRPYSFGNGTMYTIEFKEGDGAPQTVLENASKEDAEKAKAALEGAGATVELK